MKNRTIVYRNNIVIYAYFVKVLFHNYFSTGGEQPEKRILAYKQNNQLSVVLQYFINIAAI